MDTDQQAITRECRTARAAGEEISDGCARAIAAWYAVGMPSASFATSGAITDPSEVWRDLFTLRNGTDMYPGMSADEKLPADMLGTYLTSAGPRGPVAGWSRVWVR